MQNPPFIAIEGPIGVGKTSLAQAISKSFQFHLIKEIVEENPFLGKFYENIADYSFQTEMFFLTHRFQQLESVRDEFILKGEPIVSDYHVFKNKIFASRSLKPEHYDKYQIIYNVLTEDLPMPNMIIYLKASLDTLLKRVHKRARDVEKFITPEYLERLSSDYEAFMEAFSAEHPDIPVLTFNGDDLDFIENKKDLFHIFKQVDNLLTKDVHNGSKS